MPQQILLIDDHALFRSGLRMVLARGIPDAEIFDVAAPYVALKQGPDKVDLILLDMHLQGLNGLDSIDLLKARWPDVPILMLSGDDDPGLMRTAVAQGAVGYVTKSMSAERIIAVASQILSGGVTKEGASEPPASSLTPRQGEVLQFLAQGFSNKVIAKHLELSENTVRRHVQDILDYLGVANRAEAVFAARRRGIIV